MKNYYVYVHMLNGQLIYVGNGTGDRRGDVTNRNVVWHELVDKKNVVSRIVFDKITKQQALKIESLLIHFCGVSGIGLANIKSGMHWKNIFEEEDKLHKIANAKLIEKTPVVTPPYERVHSSFTVRPTRKTEIVVEVSDNCMQHLEYEGQKAGITKKAARETAIYVLTEWARKRISERANK